MSQPENTEKATPQTVRVVPIFVEGRDEPLVNKDFPDSGPPPQHHHHHLPDPPRMPSNMDFGAELPSFRHGSIFDRAKDFPVRGNMRDNIRDFFRDSPSPTQRGESPMRNIPVNHKAGEPKVHNARRQPSPQPQQAPPPPQERKRTVSGGNPPHSQEQWQQPQRASTPQATAPRKEPTPPPQPAPKPAPLDPIAKIQQIQRDVLDLMSKVEKFEGKNKKDKEYLYLDEMLTQNLLKLDTVEAEGKENVKLARREAIKCINRCLAVLEAKADAAEQAGGQPQKEPTPPKANSKEPTPDRNSVYDNAEQAPDTTATTQSAEPAASQPPQ
jgi:BCL2-associated athanogene 3